MMMRFLTSRLPLALILITIAALAVTGNFLTLSPVVVAVQIAAGGLAVWARRSFRSGTFRVVAEPAGDAIIRRGPYAVIRHPMYAAMLLFVLSGVVAHLSAITFAAGSAVVALVSARILAEERLLRARYPQYREYARSTAAVVPFLL